MEDSFSTSLPTESGGVRMSPREPRDASARQDVGTFVLSVPSNPNPNRGAHNTYRDWPVIVRIIDSLSEIIPRIGSATDEESINANALELGGHIDSLSPLARAAMANFIGQLHHKLQDGRSQ